MMYLASVSDDNTVLEFEEMADMLYRIKMHNHNKYLCISSGSTSGDNVFCIIFWLVCLRSVPFLIYNYVVNRRPGSIVFSITFIIIVVIVLPVVEYFRFKTISKLKYVYLPGSIRHISDKYIIRINDSCITINEGTHFNWENIKFCFLLGNYLLLYMGEKNVVFIKSENDINKTICEKLDQQKINIFSLDTLAINKKLAEETAKRQRNKYGPILIINLSLFLFSYFKMRSGA